MTKAALRRFSITFLPALAAYCVAWSGTPFLRSFDGTFATMPPLVPNVVMPPGTSTCVVSSVPFLLAVLAIAVIAVLPVEIAKACSRITRRPSIAYGALLAYQLVLGLDIVRANATDWWVFIWSALRVRPIDALSWMDPPFVSGSRSLWCSAIALFALGVVLWVSDHVRRAADV